MSSEDVMRYTNDYILAIPPDTTLTYPIRAVYCQICGYPSELCEYGPSAEKCIQAGNNESQNVSNAQIQPIRSTKSAKKSVQIVKQPIIIQKQRRKGNKVVTIVQNMQLHGVSIDDARKYFAQRLSCGCSKTNDEEIVIQGDVADRLLELITCKWSQIDAKSIVSK